MPEELLSKSLASIPFPLPYKITEGRLISSQAKNRVVFPLIYFTQTRSGLFFIDPQGKERGIAPPRKEKIMDSVKIIGSFEEMTVESWVTLLPAD